MVRRANWKYAGKEKGNIIYIDYNLHRTKVNKKGEVCYYDGIYPWIKKIPYKTYKIKW